MMKEAVGVISQPILRQHHILQNELAAGTHPTTLSLHVLSPFFLRGPNFANSRVESTFELRHRPVEDGRGRRG